MPGLQIWDVPTPPALKQCVFFPDNITPTTQFRTIELRYVLGITFFFLGGEIHAIHTHTSTEPYAKKTWDRFSYRRQQRVVWFYLPISRLDEVEVFGTRLRICDGRPESSDICLLVILTVSPTAILTSNRA